MFLPSLNMFCLKIGGGNFFFLKKEYENMTCSEKARTQHRVPGAGEEKKEKRRECRDEETVESGVWQHQ